MLSTLGWATVLIFTIIHIFDFDGASSSIPGSKPETATSVLHRFISSFAPTKYAKYITNASLKAELHPALVPLYRRSTTTYARVGSLTAFVQSFALLEVVHVLLGWVRSPLQTTAMQVASRLFLVWGIVEPFEAVSPFSLFWNMFVAYAWSLRSHAQIPCTPRWSSRGPQPKQSAIPSTLAASLASSHTPSCILDILPFTSCIPSAPRPKPSSSTLHFPSHLPSQAFNRGCRGCGTLLTTFVASCFAFGGRVRSIFVQTSGSLTSSAGLYVMYTYMIKQRRKVLGSSGKTIGAPPKQRKLE